jgi:hypothetical protein
MRKNLALLILTCSIFIGSCTKHEGPLMDADGKKKSMSATSANKNGLLIDPDGKPVSITQSGDNGLLIDPDGKPLQAANAGGDKNGPILDPWGKK